MGFGDLKTCKGQTELDSYMFTRSYIEGYQPSQADRVIFEALGKKPSANFEHLMRWYNHIASFGDEMKSFPGKAKSLTEYGQPEQKAKDDDDFDLFGSDDDEDEEEQKRLREERIKEAKTKKKGPIAKSTVVLDVKPWDDETDMQDLEKHVRSIEADGLLWGASKLVPLAFGIKKLQIGCVIEDDKIGTDFLEEEITKFEDLVQSVDIAAFNKL